MPRKKKPYHQMTDEELKRKLFPKPVRKWLKDTVLELEKHAEKRERRVKR